MDTFTIDDIRIFFSGQSLGNFFIKSFSIVFSVLFITYAVISYKQVQDITRAVLSSRNRFIVLVSFAQIFIGLFLLAFAILFI